MDGPRARSRDPDMPTSLPTPLHTKGLTCSLEQKQEWTKVKGRIQDIVFKEPIEQLLNLAATKIAAKREASNNKAIRQIYDLAIKSKFSNDNLKSDVVSALYPMDIFAAYILTQTNQRYRQNERSLRHPLSHPSNQPC